MDSIRQIYSTVKKIDTHGIEGYHVDNKYYDPLKMKKQKELQSSKDKIVSARPANISKKTTFIDQVQKEKAKLPGPCTYEPKQLVGKSKTQSLVPAGQRKTIFDEIAHLQKKNNFPQAGRYDKVQVEIDRAKLKSDISKAQKANYLDSFMRDSLNCPGAGSYNTYQGTINKRAPKWVSSQKKKEATSKSMIVKLPPVGTYNPLPLQYSLFENQLAIKKRRKSDLNKEQRFKKSREKPLPFYNILSEWGMKNKTTKKDILCRLSSPNTNRSVYR